MTEVSLILEGGGMRGVYTAGVLDCFLDLAVSFTACYAVSAGACHACSYLSGQRGRGFATNVDYLRDRHYCSVYSLLTTGDLFGVDMLYNRIPNELYPYDYQAFDRNPCRFYAVATNCRSGRAEYLPVRDMRRDIVAVRASSSLPMLSRMVEIGGKPYLDGGIADPIPLRKSLSDGFQKQVVVLTQHDGYQKQPNELLPLLRTRYARYPKLVEALRTRHTLYNDTLRLVRQEQKAGRAFVLQPQQPVQLRRIEKDREKLTALYQQGYADAERNKQALLQFLNE